MFVKTLAQRGENVVTALYVNKKGSHTQLRCKPVVSKGNNRIST